jgi:hypothetical protein
MGHRSYKLILLDFATCGGCSIVALAWVAIVVRLVTDNTTGALIVIAPSLLGLGAGAFFLGRALNALGRRFWSSMGWDQYLN